MKATGITATDLGFTCVSFFADEIDTTDRQTDRACESIIIITIQLE